MDRRAGVVVATDGVVWLASFLSGALLGHGENAAPPFCRPG